jgi:hypothetical protein
MVGSFNQSLQKILDVLRDPVFVKQMVWVALFGVLMVVLILVNIDFLHTNYPAPPRPPDRLLDAIPPNYDFLDIGEAFSKLQIGLMGLFFVSSADRLRRLPRLFFFLATMYILRSFAFTLTPLAQMTPPSEFFEPSNYIAQKFYHGMYFSGHTASALIQAFFFWNDRFKRIRITWFVLPLALVQMSAMIIGHQHYSIDLFGAIFVAYFVLTFDFARLIPRQLAEVTWMPWYVPQNEPVVQPAATD